jgi:CubicO group peptidase (beta-lactamase class C family)
VTTAATSVSPRVATPSTSPPEGQATGSAEVTADYRLENTMADSVGTAAELSAIGADATRFVDEAVLGQVRPVLTFDRGSGLALTPASSAMGSEYTIELLFRFDRLDGWAKIVDFSDAQEDSGLYSLDGRMDFYPITNGFGALLDADSYAHVVLTRDATDTVVAYVNGSRQLSFHDPGDIAVIDAHDTLRLFSDDNVTPNEDSAGGVSRIRLYDGALTARDVAALAAELPIPPPTLADVEALVGEQAAADRFSGAVLVSRHGEALFSDAVGMADRDRAIPNALQTRFRIGSMNKMITAVAILQLVEDGKIELTAPAGKYLAEYPNSGVATKVTIHHLLTHTGGTGDIFGPDFDAHRDELRTHDDYIELYGARSPEFEPGTRWEYSNYGFVLLGAIIEAVTGQTYYDYVDDHIYRPAGMTATGSLPESDAVPDRSIGYTRPRTGGEWNPNTDTLPYRGTAAGGGYSTVEDLTRFAEGLLTHRLLSPDSTDLLFTAKVDSAPGAGYAYGFEDLRDDEGTGPVGHGGGAPGMNGDLRIYPKSGYVVAVLSNFDPPAAQRISSYIHPRLPQP